MRVSLAYRVHVTKFFNLEDRPCHPLQLLLEDCKLKSKAFYAFTMKLNYFNDDIEVIDVLRTAVIKGDLTDPISNRLLKYVDPTQHQHIARRKNSDGSRRNVINHLRSSIYSSYIKDLYEEVADYMKLILEQASRNGFCSGRIIGEHTFKMDAKSILDLGTWENVCRSVTDSVFQSLEAEKSTVGILNKMAKKLALDVDQQIIETAVPYLELRHFLVHANGKLSSDYLNKYPNIPKTRDGFVELTYTLICNTRDSIKALVSAYDAEVISKGLLGKDDIMP